MCGVHAIRVCVVVTIRCKLLLCFVCSMGYLDMDIHTHNGREREREGGTEVMGERKERKVIDGL